MAGKLEIGLIVGLRDANVEESYRHVTKVGLASCQLSCWKPDLLTPDLAKTACRASKATGVKVSAFWAGHSGRPVWNFLEGPATIGVVPPATRAQRVTELKRGADFASWIGAPAVATHVGFIPEDPNDPNYTPTVDGLRSIVEHCAKLGIDFLFETGQETPVTLLRTIQDIGLPNVGINLDPANLILYGKANPVDALDVFGKWVKGCHAKDGLYPTDGRSLGKETPLGDGKVNFPVLIPRLKALGYQNPLTIEREISGPQQEADIRKAIAILTPML